MKETVFKVGDKVYDIVWGWGIVTARMGYNVEVKFDTDTYQIFSHDGRYADSSKPTLSFTEYTLNGFSQERPIELPEEGEIIMVSNSEKTWKMVKFIRHLPEMEYGFVGADGDDDIEEYKYFKRLR